jgi:hypothetical protein
MGRSKIRNCKLALSREERVVRGGAFTSRRGPGEGLVPFERKLRNKSEYAWSFQSELAS